ncbi:MAG TPA: DHA2 family efflux MFS transporter permease subunit [Candidatus Saccharimonadales bacterium]
MEQAEKTGFRKWLPLMVMALALFIVILDTTIINVSIKAIIGDLHSNLKAVQWVITGYSLMLAAFTITGGRLGDIFGRKRMFMIGAVVFALGSLSASRAHSASWLLVSVSLIEGAGAAMMLPATASLILAEYRGKDRAVAFGVYGAIAGAAATIGPIVGGYFTTNYSWRWNYLINPCVVAVLLASSFVLHETHERHPHKPDVVSILLSAFGLGGLVYGMIESSTYGWLKAEAPYEIFNRHYPLHGVSISAFSLAFGIILIALFLWRQRVLERKDKVPLVSTELLRTRQFIAGSTTVAIVAMSQFGLVFILPIFLQGMLGKDAFHAGLSLLPFSLAVLVAAPLSGILVGKKNVPPRWLIQAGLCVTLVGAFVLRSELSVTSTVWTLVPGLALFGFGFGLAFSQLANLTLSAVSVQQSGEASGVNNTFRQVGTSFGQALIGALLISALATQLHRDVSSSTILPPAVKPQVAAAVAANAESLGTATDASQTATLPKPVQAEILKIRNDAIVKGTRTGMVATIAIIGVGLAVSTALPLRSQRSEDFDAPSAG